MVAEIICIYAKFGKCKNEECQFHHPQDICCDKSCDIHLCLKKHPRHCRYFWGFSSCRNEDSCKFLHNIADNVLPNHTDMKKMEALDQKYDELLAQFHHYKKLHEKHEEEIATMKQQLHEQELEIHVLRGYVLPDDSQCDSIFSQTDDVTSHDNDEKDEEIQEMQTEVSPEAQKDNVPPMISDNVETARLLQKHELQTNVLNIEYLEREIIRIKDFVSNEKMVAKGRNETKQKLRELNNKMKMKFGKTGSERVLKNELESLSEKVMKIQNNFRKSVNSELEKCAEICRKEKVNIEKKALLTAGR